MDSEPLPDNLTRKQNNSIREAYLSLLCLP